MTGLLWVIVLLGLTSSSTAHADELGMQAATTAIAALPMPDPPKDDKDGCSFTDLDCKAKKAVNNWFIDLVGGATKPVFGLLSSTVLVTPELGSVEMSRAQELWGISRVIANTCFILLVTAAGVLLMSGQTMPGGDLSPQELLPRVIWGFLAANLSLPVIGYGISFANGLSTAFLQSGEQRIDPRVVTEAITTTVLASLATNGVFFALISLVVLVLAVCVAFTYVMRLALTMVLIAAAPIALMFHVLPLTDGLARLWWRGITGVLAIQVCQSLVLVTSFHLLFTDHSTMFMSPSSKSDLIDLLLAICLLYVLVRVPGWVAQTIWRSAQPRTLTRLVTSLVLYRGLGKLASGAVRAFRSPSGRRGITPTHRPRPPQPPATPGGQAPNPGPGPAGHGPQNNPRRPLGSGPTTRGEYHHQHGHRNERPDSTPQPGRAQHHRTDPPRPQQGYIRPTAPRGAPHERPAVRPPHPRAQPRPRPRPNFRQSPPYPRRRNP